MNMFQGFLESSTIHGLYYISTTKAFARLFWIIVVVFGFFMAGGLIYQSFQTWDERPVITTIETRPIAEITFPKVTVCPPRNTFTNLNYDLVRMENMTITSYSRNELINYALELLNEAKYTEILRNLSMIVEENRYFNWYHTYSEVILSTYDVRNQADNFNLND